MIEQQDWTVKTWTESRDKWYVTTLSDAGVHPDDILSGNWTPHHISLKVNVQEQTETLYIKDKQIGDSHKLHPDILAKIIADAQKNKPADIV